LTTSSSVPTARPTTCTTASAARPSWTAPRTTSSSPSSYTIDHSGTAIDDVHRQVLDALATGGPDQTFPYSDDFAAGASSWQAGKGSWSSSGGALSQTDTSRWDFVNGLNNWAGLVVRNLNSTDFESGYLVAQRNNVEVFIYRSGTNLGHAVVTGYAPGQFNRLQVFARGNTIAVYAGSGQAPVLTVTDNAFSTGGIGLASGGVSVQFDNVRLNPETTPAEARPVAVSSMFPATTARYVQVRGTELRPDGEGGYRMQLSELEVR
jgi:hypothetical protein